MDTSETYIKMADCEGIQALRTKDNWQIGDYYTTKFQDGVFLVSPLNDAWADVPLYIRHRIECIWLPHQDQLQEMVPFGPPSQIHLMHRFMESLGYGDNETSAEMVFETWEQLWLALVMKENHNKVWVEGEWIKNDRMSQKE